jgi:hypothetical protein
MSMLSRDPIAIWPNGNMAMVMNGDIARVPSGTVVLAHQCDVS